MTINEFWNIVNRINWSANYTNPLYYHKAKKMLMHMYGPKTMQEFSEQFTKRKTILTDLVAAYDARTGETVGDYGGADSFDDMISHVIGYGKDAYEAVLKDPTILNEMKYVESFAYCIPLNACYADIGPDYYREHARESIVELADIVKEIEVLDTDTAATIKDIMARLIFMVAGNFAEATRGFTLDTYAHYCAFKGNTSCALFSNLIGSCHEYVSER